MTGSLRHGLTVLLVALARAYQWTLRPLLGPNCRYHPSCSDYAIEAVRRHGPVAGGLLAGGRVLRCHPWCAGGHDPVPAPRCIDTAARRV